MSTQTIDELARLWLGDRLYNKIEQVELTVTDIGVEPEVVNGNELVREYLSEDTERAISQIDLQQERFGLHVEIENLRVTLGAKGMSLILIALTIMAILIGAGPTLEILRTLLQ